MGARRRGFALILVLVATSLVFALGVRAAAGVRAATVEAASLRRTAQMERAARSATQILLSAIAAGAQYESSDPDITTTDTPIEPLPDSADEESSIPEMPPAMRQLLGELSDESSNPTEAAAKTTAKQPQRRRRTLIDVIRENGLPDAGTSVTALGERVRVTFVDAAGLLNVNRASSSEIASLLMQVGVDRSTAERLGDEIVDYRDADDFVSPKGAERTSYEVRGLRIANADMASLEELLFTPSMTRSIFDRAEPYLTTFGSGQVHVPTAPRQVLASLDGMTAPSVERILELRETEGVSDAALAEALSPMAEQVGDRLTTRISSALRAFVAPEGQSGPIIRVDLAITSGGTVRFGYVGPAER
jgi:type II secretory pathway component PulK